MPLIIRAHGSMAGGIGPVMQVRIDGQMVYETEVKASSPTDYRVPNTARLAPGVTVDVVFTNGGAINGEDRDLFVGYLMQGGTVLLPSAAGVSYDRGVGAKAFDGLDVVDGRDRMSWSGALRITWPATPMVDETKLASLNQASRFLQQATFGPTRAEIDRLAVSTPAAWIDQQMALPPTPDFVNYFQAKQDQGADFVPPKGKSYTPMWNVRTFWRNAVTAPDQLRKRTAFALQQIFTASLADGVLKNHGRAHAGYLDTLNRNAFGNYRQLLEDVALSPAMGLYLSHMHNQKEDGSGRMPDENFARELMQLFSIGLVELNPDGTPKKDAAGQPIETYANADVMAMARVFTGWAWGYDDAQITTNKFGWGWPDYSAAGNARVDLRPMRNYAAFHAPQEKRLFAGKPWAVTIPANTPGPQSLKVALDTLFNHPNVGPFIGRQLIQRLVTSNPSPAYVARVAQAFANNGKGVRGDLGAVVRAVLMDPQARPATPGPEFGKVREPVLRVSHFLRSFSATSASGDWRMEWELSDMLQRPLNAPTVFGDYRPGYVPPNSGLADAGLVAPEVQIVSEATVATWVNLVESLVSSGIGRTPGGMDVSATLAAETTLAGSGPAELLDHLNLTLLAGRMSDGLRRSLLEAMTGSWAGSPTRDSDRARLAVFMVLASPEYLVQR